MSIQARARRGRPIYVRSEDSLPPNAYRYLRRHGWGYKPRYQATGGHWVPPGWKTIPPAGTTESRPENHGKRYV